MLASRRLVSGILSSGLKTNGWAFYSKAAGPKIAVVLSGSGVYDGTEVHEAAATLAAITRNGGTPVMFAPDKPQAHVVDHTSGSEEPNPRNVLKESARIARGDVQTLANLSPAQADAVVFPGGFGAAKNLSDFGFKGADMSVDPGVADVLTAFHKAGKPVALCCIAPVLAAKVLPGVTLTLGNTGAETDWPYQGAIDAAKSFGANVQLKNVDEICVDNKNKIVTTPAFMFNGQFHQIQDGVNSMIKKLFQMI